MKTIVWGNYKGGVGKTTSTYQVASYFAEMGHCVLLLDLDPQCSLSHICSRTMVDTPPYLKEGDSCYLPQNVADQSVSGRSQCKIRLCHQPS